MRKLMVVIAVVAQVVVLATMVYGRESIIQAGERVLLRTAPLDPRDPFRGDYVRLQYPMNRPVSIPLQWSNDHEYKRGGLVYAVLKKSIGSIHEVDFITNVKPDAGVYIRGRTLTRASRLDNLASDNERAALLRLKFGIEQMYVEQDSGFEIEKMQGVRGGLQVPMEVEVALSTEGVAVLTGHQWSPVGMEMIFLANVAGNQSNATTDTTAQTDTSTQLENEEQPDTLSIRVMNTSEKSITLNNPGNDCAFTIVPTNLLSDIVQAKVSGCNSVLEPKALTLASGESYTIGVNLSDPRWFVESESQSATDLRLIDLAMYRIVYKTPENTPEEGPNNFWMGELPSQAFNGRGRVD